MNDGLERKLRNLPSRPGVYLFRDERGALLYVGKAKALKSRVRSYFGTSDDGRLATRFIRKNVADLEFIVTGSEKEALLLENNLIKKLQPRYNLRLRDDKTFLNLRIGMKDEFPRIVPTRRVRRDGALYFGPYANTGAIRKTLRFLRSFVPLRDCKDSEFKHRDRPCLEYEIGRCSAPCVGLISREEYRTAAEKAVSILRGNTRDLARTLRTEMEVAAKNLQFERAATLRDHLRNLETSVEVQEVETRTLFDVDALGIWREAGLTEIVVLFVREGKLVRSTSFTLETELPEDELLSQFLHQFYGQGRPVPEEVLLPARAYGTEALEEWLSELRMSKVVVGVPKSRDRTRFLELARDNARLTLRASTDRRQRTASLLEEMKQFLDLKNVPLGIECFDVSTTGGRATSASCVTFKEGEPRRSGYRHYKIRQADPQDEYACMAEVLERRYKVAARERTVPELIMVDGGKGQWNVANQVLERLGIKGADLVAIAKGGRRGRGVILDQGEQERAFTSGTGEAIVLLPSSAVTMLLQRVRDEAHRFALRLHRKRRGKESLASELDAIPLVGKQRKRILLERFGDLEGVRRATEKELAAISGIGVRAAREIARYFGKA